MQKFPTSFFVFLLFFLFLETAFAQHVQPENLEYLGAFRLADLPGDYTWDYSGNGMTYYPEGDPTGADDGFPGSLFIIGHDWYQMVSEVSIPVPVKSAAKNPGELNTAETLQQFADITAGMFGYLEMPTADLTYVRASTSEETSKFYFCFGQHFQYQEPSIGFCDLNLSAPHPKGPFYFGNLSNYAINDYMFTFPQRWAEEHLGGRTIATGRFREGQWGGLGPALFAFPPFPPNTHPAAGDSINDIAALLLYGTNDPNIPEIVVDDNKKMIYYQPSDQWSGATWLSDGENSAVIFVGTKALGNCWYGFSDGTIWPEEPPYPPVPDPPHDNRGWWCDSIHAQILFYDPYDLAAVANGEMESFEPQPYAVLDINDIFYDPGFDYWRYKRWSTGAACFDEQNRHLFVIERRAEEDKSLIHVWKLHPSPTKITQNDSSLPHEHLQAKNYPNPFNSSTIIEFSLSKEEDVQLKIFDISGREIESKLFRSGTDAGNKFFFNAEKLPSGIYFYQLKTKNEQLTKKMTLIR